MKALCGVLIVVSMIMAPSELMSQTSSGSTSSPFSDWTGSISTSTLPTGSTTISGSTAEAAYIAYQAGAQVADRIATKVCAANPSNPLLLFNNLADVDAIRSLLIVRRQLQAAKIPDDILAPIPLTKIPNVTGVTNPLTEPGPLGVKWTGSEKPAQSLYEVQQTVRANPNFVLPILSAIDAGLQIVSLFKSNTTITGASLTADDLSLQFIIASKLRSRCPNVKLYQTAYSVPNLQPVDFTKPFTITQTSPILALVSDAIGRQTLISQQSALFTALVVTPLNSTIAQLQKIVGTDSFPDVQAALNALPNSQIASVVEKRKKLTLERDAFTALAAAQQDLALVQAQIATLNAYQTQSSSVTSSLTGTGGAGLQAAVKAEALNCALSQSANCSDNAATPFVLVTKTTIIGGDDITKQNVFKNKLGFSGTLAASYVLFGSDGSVNISGMDQCYAAVQVQDMISTTPMKNALAITCTP